MLALVLAPTLSTQAEEGSLDSSVEVKVNSDLSPLPPVKDQGKGTDDGKKFPLRGDIRKIADIKDRSVDDDDAGDDKGGLRIKTEDRLRMDSSNNPQLSEKQKAEMKKKFDDRKAEILKKIEVRKGELKIKLEDKAKERVKNILTNMFKMLSNQLDRLSKADARIGEKLASLKEKGLDVSAASSQYVVAQTALAKAKVDVEATSSISIDQASTETSKETLHALVKTATDSIKAAGAEYRKIFPLLPKEAPKAEVETSTSASTSAE